MQLLSEQGRYPGAGGNTIFGFPKMTRGRGVCADRLQRPHLHGVPTRNSRVDGWWGFGILFHETIHDVQPDLLFFGFHGLCSLSLRVLLCIGLDAHLAWSYPYRRNLAFGLVAIILFNLLFPQLSLVYLGGFLEGKGGVRGKDCSFPPFSYSPFFCCL